MMRMTVTTKTAHMWKIEYLTPGGNQKHVLWRGKTASSAVNSWQCIGRQQWKIVLVTPHKFTYKA